MARIGVIGGTIFFNTDYFKDFKEQVIKNDFGKAVVYTKDNIVFIARHGSPPKIPPHCINHQANFSAMKKLGVKHVIAANAVGSLKLELKPQDIIIPDDYVGFFSIPTIFNNEIAHLTPKLSSFLRKKLIESARQLKIKVIEKGVYVQTLGPRLETKAEVNVLKGWGDVIGMNAASEAIIAQELGIEYAMICSVCNYANGIGNKGEENELDLREIAKNSMECSKNVFRVVMKAMELVKKR